MEASCLRHNLVPGASALFLDYLYNFDRVQKFYSGDPFDSHIWTEAAKTIQYPASRRQALVAALEAQGGDPSLCAKLAKPETVAVVTGQQVGLFSGPAYTVFKAATAVRLAKRLNEQGIPAVPLFWLATEDHDLAEVDHVWIFDSHTRPVRLQSSSITKTGGPVGQSILKDLPLNLLRKSLADFPFGDEIVNKVEQAYQTGRSLGASFRHLVEDLLQGYGLLFIDPLEPAIRKIMAPLLSEAAVRSSELTNALLDRDKELQSAGYHSQVHIDKKSSLLFLLDQGRREALKRNEHGQLTHRDRVLDEQELHDLGESLSPNALLRPVAQDYLLPTIAYVGGPAEIAYFAQSEALYQRLLGRMPIVMPRNGFTLVDARAEKLLDKYKLRVQDLIATKDAVQSNISRQIVPQELSSSVASTSAAIRSGIASLGQQLDRFDKTLTASAKKSEAKMLYQLGKLERKVQREQLRRDGLASEASEYLSNLVYPERHLQERFYSIIPFMAKHGLDLPRHLLEYAHLDCPDHMIRVLD